MLGELGEVVMRRALIATIVAAGLAFASPGARAAEAPYAASMERLSEILGSLHFLRNLCGENGTAWRDEMNELLATENPEPELRAKLVASFNHGYRSFDAVYTTCTESAYAAITRYMAEGQKLSREIAVRYGD